MKKNALVTGGTKGIGLGITKMLLELGYYVTVTYGHDENSALQFEKMFYPERDNFELIKVDLGNKKDIYCLINLIKEKGALDCLIFNAGVTLRRGITDFTDEEWEYVMNVNVNAPVIIIRDLYTIMPPNSRIIFIGSEMGIHPHGTSLAYGVSKTAVHGLAKNLVKFFEGTGTTINAIAPGFVETEWQKNKPIEIRKSICNKTAIGRFATVDEIVEVVQLIINNAFVNGSIIEVNGGYNYK